MIPFTAWKSVWGRIVFSSFSVFFFFHNHFVGLKEAPDWQHCRCQLQTQWSFHTASSVACRSHPRARKRFFHLALPVCQVNTECTILEEKWDLGNYLNLFLNSAERPISPWNILPFQIKPSVNHTCCASCTVIKTNASCSGCNHLEEDHRSLFERKCHIHPAHWQQTEEFAAVIANYIFQNG